MIKHLVILPLLLVSLFFSSPGQQFTPIRLAGASVTNACGGSGGPDVARFNVWLGQNITSVQDSWLFDSWSDFSSESACTINGWHSAAIANLSYTFTFPMIVSGATLAGCVAGTYDTYYQPVFNLLVADGFGGAALRIGHEMNTTDFPWKANADPTNYVACFQHLVTMERATPGAHFTIDWCPLLGEGSIAPDSVYPGNAYVDRIGEDVYDFCTSYCSAPSTNWGQKVTEAYGLNWQVSFAASNGKALSWPEWGLIPSANSGVGDDLLFMTNMIAWSKTYRFAETDYFNESTSAIAIGPSAPLTNSTVFPTSTTYFIDNFSQLEE